MNPPRLIVLWLSLIAIELSAQTALQGYVLLHGEQARLARSGNLFRIVVRELVRPDGSKATVYRDIDYPIRLTSDETPPPPKKSDPDAADEEIETKPGANAKVWAYLGKEYEDPPPRDASPSPLRLRRPGPRSVVYEFDAYVLTGGIRDEFLRLEVDFSGTHPVVRSGRWSMENESGKISSPKPAEWDFLCGQGAYGEVYGKIETGSLHEGVPDVIAVTLVRKIDAERKRLPEEEESSPHKEGTGYYRLKRKPPAAE